MIRGYWKVTIDANYFDGSKVGLEDGDQDFEHILESLRMGCTEGDLLKEVEDE